MPEALSMLFSFLPNRIAHLQPLTSVNVEDGCVSRRLTIYCSCDGDAKDAGLSDS
jgi:hypothetical protein